jgi:hypothetical protein
MEVQRAFSDLAEVRDRLARLQRFEGYSGPAALASAAVAFGVGILQRYVAPAPTSAQERHLYFLMWLACLGAALLLNYGAVAVWAFRNRGPGAASRFHSAALSFVPSVILGGVLTAALADRGAYALLPGTWFAFYALGLFASHDIIPPRTMLVTAWFLILALVFLLTPAASSALHWWVMPAGFGLGQAAIGAILWRSRAS